MSDQSEARRIGVNASVQQDTTVSISVRHNMAVQRMKAAAHYARLCFEIEQEGQQEEKGDGLPPGHRYYATDGITNAYASVEATINEFFQDAKDKNDRLAERLEEQTLDLIGSHWSSIRQNPTLQKYQWALFLAREEAFNEGAAPFQQIDDLRFLRNQLVHFKPEWSDDLDRHAKVEERLKTYGFASVSQGDKANPFFPSGCLSHSCAGWAIELSIEFIDAFYARLGADSPFDEREFPTRL